MEMVQFPSLPFIEIDEFIGKKIKQIYDNEDNKDDNNKDKYEIEHSFIDLRYHIY